MKLRLERFVSDDEATCGLLYLDDEFFCFTLEDQHQDVKVMHETRIPPGRYQIHLRNVGDMTLRYQEKFPEMHRGMLWLQKVPEFKFIYFHPGNTDDHTSGCILIGHGADTTPKAMRVRHSVDAYRNLYARVVDAAEAKELSLKIIDLD
jgi:hypothetical protein